MTKDCSLPTAGAAGRLLPLLVVTGAGASAESGVPTFRGRGGLWHSYRAEDLATPQAFARDPRLVWKWYDWRRGVIAACAPNACHTTLAEMERVLGAGLTLVTQNVDGLHQAAGSRDVVELHGCVWRLRCTRDCCAPWEDRRVPLPEIPPRCPHCEALARPDVVWFGEALPAGALSRALAAARACRTMLVVGTSGLVSPASQLPALAANRGAQAVEINPVETLLTGMVDRSIREPAAVALPRLWQHMRETGTVLAPARPPSR